MQAKKSIYLHTCILSTPIRWQSGPPQYRAAYGTPRYKRRAKFKHKSKTIKVAWNDNGIEFNFFLNIWLLWESRRCADQIACAAFPTASRAWRDELWECWRWVARFEAYRSEIFLDFFKVTLPFNEIDEVALLVIEAIAETTITAHVKVTQASLE